ASRRRARRCARDVVKHSFEAPLCRTPSRDLTGPRGQSPPGGYNSPMDERDYEPIQPRGTDWMGRLRKALGPLIAAGIALAKWSFVLLKFSSIFIAVAAYALLFGWTFAIG